MSVVYAYLLFCVRLQCSKQFPFACYSDFQKRRREKVLKHLERTSSQKVKGAKVEVL